MTKRDQLIPLESLPYFTIQAFKQVVGVGEDDSQRVRELLSRWTKEGHILRLKRGVYMTQKFYLLHHNETEFNPSVSAIILPQSYLSLHYVLQRHGILTEVTYAVTGVTQKNTRTIENQLGIYEYHHIKPELYKGFSHHEYHGVRYYIASKARALFDLFYFYPLPRKYRVAQTNLTEDLRLNIDDFSPDDKEKFAGYILDSDSPKMEYVLENLRRNVWRH
jgi:predicted transcriptional regulator of viral defense system